MLQDIGQTINAAIDYGQIEGAFVQGQGLFTTEESLWLQNGQIFTRGPGAYKIPSALYPHIITYSNNQGHPSRFPSKFPQERRMEESSNHPTIPRR